MLDLKQEQRQWLQNYKALQDQMRAAWRFQNTMVMDDIHKRMTMTLIQIASVTEKLEKEGDADAHTRIGTAISRYVEVAKNTTVNLKSISRNGRK